MKKTALPNWLSLCPLLLLSTAAALSPAYAEEPAPVSDPCTGNFLAVASALKAPETVDLPVQTELTPVDGAYSQTLPIAIPEGLADLTPDLGVRYRSQNGNGNLGVGWSLELGAIELSARRGVSLENPRYEARLPGWQLDLVPCPSLPGEFRAHLDSEFSRFAQVTAPDGLPAWVMTTRAGVRYFFGLTPAARLSDPKDPRQTVRWSLQEIVDLHNNVVTLSYEPQSGPELPTTVAYTGHREPSTGAFDIVPPVTLHLSWEPRPDKSTYFRFAVPRDLSYRLARINVSAEGRSLRDYLFDYRTSPVTGRSLLVRLRVQAADGSTEPPSEFRYQSSDYHLQPPQEEVAPAADPAWSDGAGWGDLARSASIHFADVDGDGRTDVCGLAPKGLACFLSEDISTTVKRVFIDKLGEHEYDQKLTEPRFHGAFAPGPAWTGPAWRDPVRVASLRFVDINADGRADACARDEAGVVCALSPSRLGSSWPLIRGPEWPDSKGWNQLSTGGTLAFPDLNGDGFADVCARSPTGILCALGTGGSFGPVFTGPAWGDSPWSRIEHYSTIAYPDLDGDGADEVCGRGTDGIACARLVTSPALGFTPPKLTSVHWSNAAGWNVAGSFSTIAFPDLNGDAVSDLCGRSPSGQLQCALGTGQDDFGTIFDGPSLPDGDGWSRPSQLDTLRFVDVNADGRSDLCGRAARGWTCWPSRGNGFGDKVETLKLTNDSDWNKPQYETSLSPVDFTGAGVPAVCGRSAAGITCLTPVSSSPWEVLSSWSNGYGGEWTMEYRSSSAFHNFQLPSAIPVVVSITAQADKSEPSQMTFAYGGGWVDLRKDDFRGFAWIRIEGPRAEYSRTDPYKIRELWLHQGDQPLVLPWPYQSAEDKWLAFMTNYDNPLAAYTDAEDPVGALRGKAYRTLERDSAGTYYQEHLLTYRPSSTGPSYFFPLVHDEALTCRGHCTYPLPSVHTPIFKGNAADFDNQLKAALAASHVRGAFKASSTSSETFFDWDRLGNLTRLDERGDPAVPDDDRVTVFSYQVDTTRWLLDRLASKELYQHSTAGLTLQSKTVYTYGAGDPCGLQAGAVTDVDLSSRAQWVSGQTYATDLYGYDKFGNLLCSIDPEKRATYFSYDAKTASRLTAKKDPLGHTSLRSYYGLDAPTPATSGLFGELAAVADEAGGVTRFHYDSLGHKSRIDQPDGAFEIVERIDLGTPGRQKIRHLRSTGLWQETYFDGFGREVLRKSGAPEGKKVVEEFGYNGQGFLERTSEPYFEGGTAHWRTVARNSSGDPTLVREADGREWHTCYFKNQVVSTSPGGRLRLEEWDAFGRSVLTADLVKNPLREKPPLPWNKKDPIFLPADPLPLDPLPDPCGLADLKVSSPVRRVLRPDSLPSRILDAQGNASAIEYDGLGRVAARVWPTGARESFTYDLSGLPLTATDARGAVTAHEYDTGGRLSATTTTLNGVRSTTRRAYDAGPYGTGRLTHLTSDAEDIAFSYDVRGRIIETVHTAGGQSYRLSFAFDGDGRKVRQTWPDGRSVAFRFDGPGLAEITDGKTRYATFADFTADGIPRTTTLGNGLTWSRQIAGPADPSCKGPLGSLCSDTVVDQSGKTLLARQYQYDPDVNLVELTDDSEVFSFAYDEREQLISRKAPNPMESESFAYDILGNMTAKTGHPFKYGGAGIPPDAAAKLDGLPVPYDRDGRPLGFGSQIFSWNGDGFLASVSKDGMDALAITYGADGRLFETHGPTGEGIRRIDPSLECRGTRCTDYVIVGGRRLISLGGDGRTEYGVHDLVGSLLLVTDAAGAVAAAFRYDAFGVPALQSPPATEAPLDGRRFANLEWFGEVGLYAADHRFYSPVYGRFLSPDPLRLAGAAEGWVHAYGYGRNNPVVWADSSGLFPVKEAVLLAIAVRDFGAAHPVATNIGMGALKVALGIGGMLAATETANPALGYESALTFAAGGAQLAIGLTEAFSSSNDAASLQSSFEQAENYLDPDKVFAGEIANAFGVDRDLAYFGVDAVKLGKGLLDLPSDLRHGKSKSVLGIGNLLVEFQDFLNDLANQQSPKQGKSPGNSSREAKDPFKDWEPKSIFTGDAEVRDWSKSIA